METIKLKKSSIVRFGIETDEGVDTGNYLEFDLEDLTLPTRAQECLEMHKKNVQNLNAQRLIISKKQDKKGKKLMSANEEALLKAVQEYYRKEEEAIDYFLGKGSVKKLLNGRNPYITMFDDIEEYLNPIMPILTNKGKGIEERLKEIRNKYSAKQSDVIE